MELRQYIKSVSRWWWLLLLSTAIAATASYAASSRQPRIYQTTTTLLVGQVIQNNNPSNTDFTTSERLAESYAEMAQRQPILQASVDSLNLNMSWQNLKWRVNAYSLPRTQLLGISVQDTSPQRAVAVADEIAYQLILQSPSSPENKAREERSEFVQNQLDDLETRIEAAKARVKGLEGELDSALSARQIQDIQTEIANLETLINNWQTNYSELLNFLDGGDSRNYLTVIEPAQVPTTPISPQVTTNIMLAAAVGFVLALSAALLLEYIDDTIKSADDLSASLGLTALGSVNRINGKDYKDKLITSHNPFSPVSESYRMLRTNLQFMTIDQTTQSIMITSPNPGEGKSITAANLGVIMAQANLKTVIVDADLRRPIMHKVFQVSNLDGVTDLMRAPEVNITNQLKDTGVENLWVITSGSLPPNPSEMIGSRRMAELLERLKETADIIIVDSPPTLPVTDAVVLSSQVDGVILVTQAKRTRRDATKQALERLEHVGARLLGGVLNNVSGKGDYNHYSYYTRTKSMLANQSQSSWRRFWQRLPVLRISR
jgi:non-specific protein-tyrosine kinase